MSDIFDSVYWTAVLLAVIIFGILLGDDVVSSTLLVATGAAWLLGFWAKTRHIALFISSGTAAICGAILTLIFEAMMGGAGADPSMSSLIIAFATASTVSGVLLHRNARDQARRNTDLDGRLAALSTRDDLRAMEERLTTLISAARVTEADSWRSWWRSRPRGRCDR